jgi:adenine-specific DNA-methyltransferase
MVYPGSTIERNNDNWNYRWSKTKVEWGKNNGFLVFKNIDGKWNAYFKQYFKVDNNDKPIERSVPYQNIIKLDQFNSTQGTKEIMNIFGKKYFDYPKPSELMKYLLQICTDKNSLVLDFFSGSGSTAHATMQLNSEDEGSRRFVVIQLQEATSEDSEAYKAGYKNICEIGKERIRRAGKQILEEQKAKQGDLFAGKQKKIDVGFRVFKCADSNMKDVYYAPADYNQRMLFDLEDNIKEDRNDLDLLFGCMLDWGVTLDLPLRTEKVDGVNIHVVNEGDLVACFEKHIPESVIDHIASLLPMRVVLRDSCFDEAKEKMNFFEIFKQRTGWSEEEVRKNVKVI